MIKFKNIFKIDAYDWKHKYVYAGVGFTLFSANGILMNGAADLAAKVVWWQKKYIFVYEF